jgi:tetratricopeptide (TPR) repeat protein
MLDWLGWKKKPMPVVSLNELSPQIARERELGLLSQEQGPEPSPEPVVGDSGEDRSWTSLRSPTSGDAEVWYEQGNQRYFAGDFWGAIASYDQAIAIKADYHEAWNNRGVSLDNLGRREEAIASYDQAIALKPDKHEAWNNRGNSLANLGRREESIES